MEVDTLWNLGLTAALTLLGWLARAMYEEQRRVQILLNKTREEIARDYVTKGEVQTDMGRVIYRLERLDEKLDRLMER